MTDDGPAPRTVREERSLSPMRRTIADRLGESYRNAVHVTASRAVDAEPLFAAVDAAEGRVEAAVSLLDPLLVAPSRPLDEHPAFNATFEDGVHRTYEEHNLGIAVAVDSFTPIINPPEVAVLGVGRVRDRARPADGGDDGDVAFRRELSLDLSFDHRVVDGADAARFLGTLNDHVARGADLLDGQ